jgi:hypothetical protein
MLKHFHKEKRKWVFSNTYGSIPERNTRLEIRRLSGETPKAFRIENVHHPSLAISPTKHLCTFSGEADHTYDDALSRNCLNVETLDVQVYRGRHYSSLLTNSLKSHSNIQKIYDAKTRPRSPKAVVFDLDETIGSFSELYLLWTAIFTQGIYDEIPDPKITQGIFNELLELYPEFLRYGILHILDFIRTKIQTGESHRIFLYTNNQCDFTVCTGTRPAEQPSPTEWVEMIIVYLNWKIRASDTIFAKPICAFKINNRIIEPLRETTSKTHRDFLKCAILPKHTEICFIDDSYHSRMVNNKIYYIQPPPYYHHLKQRDIIDRFVASPLHDKLIKATKREIPFSFAAIPRQIIHPGIAPNGEHSKNTGEKETFHTLMYYIKEFFCITVRDIHTRKKRFRIGKFTRKNRRT